MASAAQIAAAQKLADEMAAAAEAEDSDDAPLESLVTVRNDQNGTANREDASDDEVMPTRKKRGYVTLSDRAPRPSRPPDASSSDDEVMPTKRPRGPPKRRGN